MEQATPVRYTLEFSGDDVKVLWEALQRAAMPRATTDHVATEFMRQVAEQNEQIKQQAAAQLNGARPQAPVN